MNWHHLPIETINTIVDSSPNGISVQEAKLRLVQNGANTIQEKKHSALWMIFLRQFNDLMIYILIAAAITSGIIGDIVESIVILVIVFINAIIGFIQEFQAEKSLEALRKMAAPFSTAIRGGEVVSIPTIDLVSGDLVVLQAGDIVPADIRLSEVFSIKIDESALTGESIHVDKSTQTIAEANIPLADRNNMLYKGSLVSQGHGKGMVVATGMDTELGKIAGLIEITDTESPLKRKMTDFSKKLSLVIFGICFIVFAAGWARGEPPLTMLLIAISLAVAAIPESLPTLVTIALAYGAKKLMQKKALIRKLSAVETLGSVTVICTDKTGTLTLNKMKVVQWLDCTIVDSSAPMISSLLLNTSLNQNVLIHEDNTWQGDPTEIALVEESIRQLGSEQYNTLVAEYPRVAELPFDENRKCMSTIHAYKNKYIVLSKGAFETISTLVIDDSTIKNYAKTCKEWADKGIRVLAFGYKELNELPSPISIDAIEKDLLFLGLVGMMDPPRAEAFNAIAACKTAGIKPIMITGDHPATAASIATAVGILGGNDKIITGIMLEQMSEANLVKEVEQIAVFARVSPEQKLKIIKALQANQHFLAMTGDGVNDAPSLKAADIGIAMGINGTEVSKSAADMILLDDNFATIVNAVREGRIIYDNIRKFVKYIMTCNSAEIWTIFLAPFLGLPMPLLPIQILWINLITDGLPGLALVKEKAEPDIMDRPPRSSTEHLFSRGIAIHIIWVGLFMAGLTLGIQSWAIYDTHTHWQTMVFTVLSFCQLAHVLAIRSDRQYLFELGIFSNMPLIVTIIFTCILQLGVIYLPFANSIFKTQPLSAVELTICIATALLFFHVIECEKFFKRRKNISPNEKNNTV
jgi:Ca2+-transporting ATPase